jgi:LRR receptor-like serine/threonine-protein kinase FLS2
LIVFSKLQSLDVYSNIIGGTIPTALETLTDLSLIDMEENLLTGSPFLDISSLRELSSYRVSSNVLSGTISNDFNPGASSSLHELWFARNKVIGSIPESLFSQNTEIQSFIAYGNNLSGSLPSTIGLLRNLVKLQLHENALTSTIPNELFSDTALEELRLDRNMLEGTVPTLLGDLVNLVDLRIGENLFTGTLPAEIARLSNLGKLSSLLCYFTFDRVHNEKNSLKPSFSWLCCSHPTCEFDQFDRRHSRRIRTVSQLTFRRLFHESIFRPPTRKYF